MSKRITVTKRRGYFDIKKYLKIFNINWRTDSAMIMLNAERNIGKSTSVWNLVEEYWKKYDYKRKLIYVRTSLEQSKRARLDFNERFRNKYIMSGGMIYKLVWSDDNKKIISKFEIGTYISLSTGKTIKSGTFDNYHMLFFDEYNDDVMSSNQYMVFNNILKTAERYSKPFLSLFIGNKDNANNEFMVNWGVERSDDSDEDSIQIPIKGEPLYFIDVGFNTFSHLKDHKSMANVFATLNEETDRYINKAGYIKDFFDDVVNYNKRVAPTRGRDVCIFVAASSYFLVGYFGELQDKVFIKKVSNNDIHLYNEKGVTFVKPSASDAMFSMYKGGISDKDDTMSIIEFLYDMNQRTKLYFCGFDIRNYMTLYISSYRNKEK